MNENKAKSLFSNHERACKERHRPLEYQFKGPAIINAVPRIPNADQGMREVQCDYAENGLYLPFPCIPKSVVQKGEKRKKNKRRC